MFYLSLKLSDVCKGFTIGGGGALLFFICPPGGAMVRSGVEATMRLLWRRTGEKLLSGDRSPWLPLIRDPLLELEAPAL